MDYPLVRSTLSGNGLNRIGGLVVMSHTSSEVLSDEQELAALGYKQELRRSWSGFSNFAISFSIICILSGGLTSFGQAWNNGGPAVIAIGWPVVCGLILIIGL